MQNSGRTDLAAEAIEGISGLEDGVVNEHWEDGGVAVRKVQVLSKETAKLLGKAMGTYLSFDMKSCAGKIDEMKKKVGVIGKYLKEMLPEYGLVFVVGLGNRSITPDSLGPCVAEKVLATRHIPEKMREKLGLMDLRMVSVLAPGVLGKTGIEVSEILKSLVAKIKPVTLIVVDALAARKVERIGTMLQISDTGISPGSGVGNLRPEINRETMGVPVISMGVPTVVDAKTFGISDGNTSGMILTPREIDTLIDEFSELISSTINAALQPVFSPEDIAMLV